MVTSPAISPCPLVMSGNGTSAHPATATARDPSRAILVGIVFMSVLLSRPTLLTSTRGRLVYSARLDSE